jgi:hypothetical protein
MVATKGSITKIEPSPLGRARNKPPYSLLLRVVPSLGKSTWRLFSRVGASRRPRLIYADPTPYPTWDAARKAGRMALAGAVAACTVSGPDGEEGDLDLGRHVLEIPTRVA